MSFEKNPLRSARSEEIPTLNVNPKYLSDCDPNVQVPSLDEVMAKLSSQHQNTSVLQRARQPTANTTPATAFQSMSNSSESKKRRSTDTPKYRVNRCPLPGTREAKERTIKASLGRCKTEEKKLAFLAKRGLSEEECLELLNGNKRSCQADKTVRISPVKQSSQMSAENFVQSASMLPSLEEVLRSMPWSCEDLSKIHCDAYRKATDIFDYYFGLGEQHLFCFVSGFGNIEITRQFGPSNFACVTAVQHPSLNGNSALRVMTQLLPTIQWNCATLSHELQTADNLWRSGHGLPHFMVLESVICSCFAAAAVSPPSIISPKVLSHGSFNQPTFVIDITDMTRPRYCYLHGQDGTVKPLYCYPKDLGFSYYHAPVFIHDEPYATLSRLSQFSLMKISAILSTWPFLEEDTLEHDLAIEISSGDFERELDLRLSTFKAYEDPWPIKYPPELLDLLLHRMLKPEDIHRIIAQFLGWQRNDGYYHDLVWIRLPFAPFVTPQFIAHLLQFYRRLYGLTLAGANIFTTPQTCQILKTAQPGLVYLDLLSCQIPDSGLAVIREIKTLDIFIHQSTIAPGWSGIYAPSTESTKGSLKVCVTYLSDDGKLSERGLSQLMEDYTYSQDLSILATSHISYRQYCVQHPFMGPLSAVNCLKLFVTKLHQMEFSPNPLFNFDFYCAIFSRGYTQSCIGLPVRLGDWSDSEENQGTTLVITSCRRKIYALFSQRDSGERRIAERFTPSDFLARYSLQFVNGMTEDIVDICEGLKNWCGEGCQIPREQLRLMSPYTSNANKDTEHE